MTETGTTISVSEVLQRARGLLKDRSDSPELDAEVLLRHTTGWDTATLIVKRDQSVEDELVDAFLSLVLRRARGEPVAHLTGEREFWSLGFRVTPTTLIPRPDTETLVERALEVIPQDAGWRILDLGTGSGNIAIAVALARPRCRVFAVDIDPASVELARGNAHRHGTDNLVFETGDWFEPFAEMSFEVVLGNPPYIAESDPHLEQGDVAFEPRRALVSGCRGLDDIDRITHRVTDYLTHAGRLLLEHGDDQGAEVRRLFEQAGLHSVRTLRDLGGRERVTEGLLGA